MNADYKDHSQLAAVWKYLRGHLIEHFLAVEGPAQNELYDDNLPYRERTVRPDIFERVLERLLEHERAEGALMAQYELRKRDDNVQEVPIPPRPVPPEPQPEPRVDPPAQADPQARRGRAPRRAPK